MKSIENNMTQQTDKTMKSQWARSYHIWRITAWGKGTPLDLNNQRWNDELMVGAPQGQLSLMGRNYIFSPSWHPSNYGARIKIMYGDGSSKRTSSSLAPYLFPLDSLKLNLNYQSLKVAVKALFLLSHTRSIVLMIREYFLVAR